MEINLEREQACEKGGGEDVGFAGDEMEGEGKGDRGVGVNVEEMLEVDPSSSRKDEQLYKKDEQQLLAIFPKEVWELIVGKLKKDPDAQTNCANASPYFWKLLRKDRVLFLFPKVVEVLAPQNEKLKFDMRLDTETEEDDNDSDDEEYTGFRGEEEDNGNEWKLTVLECRLVCSAWNKGVELCYQSATMAGIQELSIDQKNLNPMSAVNIMGHSWTNDLFKIESNEDIEYFLEEFQQSHFSGIGAPPKNPVFGRWLFVEVRKGNRYKRGITKILELCGKEIWYCCMSWYVSSRTTGKEVCGEIAKWLGLMPNLKFLSMLGPATKRVSELTTEEFLVSPIPKLEELEMLDLDETSGLIVSQMLRVNGGQLKVLRMASILEGVDLEVGASLKNLREFYSLPSKAADKMLEEYGHHWKQLNKLYLVDGSKFFGKMAMNLGNRLTELVLKDPFGKNKKRILKESREKRLELPGIRKLTLWIEGLFYLDFIRPLIDSLEHLEINGDVEEELEMWHFWGETGEVDRIRREQSIELVGFEGRMDESNVWKIFGKLETLKMHLGEGDEFMMFLRDGRKYLCTVKDDD